MIFCPRCDNPIEDDLQEDNPLYDPSSYLCVGGPNPCGFSWDKEQFFRYKLTSPNQMLT